MKRIRLLVLLLVLSACADPAGSPPATDPPGTSTTTSSSVAVIADEAFTLHARVPFTDLLVLDVLEPRRVESGTVVVLIHGGGWVGGERADIAGLAEELARNGVLVYNAAYRTMALGGTYPTTYEDIVCAVEFAGATADDYGGDPDRIVLVGYSAGAHLAAVVALAADEFSPACRDGGAPTLADGFVGIAGPYDSDQFSPLLIPFFGGTRTDRADAWAAGNPYSYLDRRPNLPIHLMHGTADRTVPVAFTQDFAEALEGAGREVAETIIAGAGHREMIETYAPEVVAAITDLLP